MPKVSLYKTDGSEAGTIDLKDEIFGIEVNEAVMHQVVVAQLANARQGTHSALTRAEVRGGGIKPYRQKGTGRARHGSSRSPIWRTGGMVFAIKPRDYSQKVNKKVKRLAIKSALSMKVADQDIIVLDALNLEAPKTRLMAGILNNFSATKALIVTSVADEAVVRASNNIPGVKTVPADCINVYDLLNYTKLVITQDAVKKVEEVFA